MKRLEQRILEDGVMEGEDVLKVDSFLNHQMDVALFAEMGKEWARLFAQDNVTKILTIEASGIGIACVVAQQFGVPVLFAKKNKTKNIAGEVYTSPAMFLVLFFLAKMTGTPKDWAVIQAMPMPEASMVRILLTPQSPKRR